ncbi:hypothetical protein SPRI_5569 [Streptomyces pristinaespiralis]|uniref:Uncharacterized protein n=1 Tax=Streptomyces pristinaespiralis TaxID=38300 RepID=A0A0M4DW91_STRPR|nr:hypothetical protein SPRI_5569 [Streptomyces pristinaespiralis]
MSGVDRAAARRGCRVGLPHCRRRAAAARQPGAGRAATAQLRRVRCLRQRHRRGPGVAPRGALACRGTEGAVPAAAPAGRRGPAGGSASGVDRAAAAGSGLACRTVGEAGRDAARRGARAWAHGRGNAEAGPLHGGIRSPASRQGAGRIRSPASRQGAPRRSAARGRPAYGTVSGAGGPAATLGDTRPSSRHTLGGARPAPRHRQRHRWACRHARRHGPSSRHTLGGTRPGRPTAPSAAQAGLPPRSATRGRAAATRSPAAARSETRTLRRRDGDARRAAPRWAARPGPARPGPACGSVSGSRICGPPSRGSGPGAARHCPRAPSAARTSTRAAPTGRPGGRRGPV